MCTIPLDLERRFEQRWAARFSDALQEHREKQRQHLTAPDEKQREAHRVELALGRRRVSGRPGIARIAK